jgi:hypothetical protein
MIQSPAESRVANFSWFFSNPDTPETIRSYILGWGGVRDYGMTGSRREDTEGAAPMRTGITLLVSLSALFLTASAHAQHGGGHVMSAPQAPHFSAPHFSQPMMPYFEQPMMPHFNQPRTTHVNQSTAPHVNQANGVRSNIGRQAGSDLASAQHNNSAPVGRYVNRTTSKVHALSNALQQNHAITGRHSGSSSNSKLAAALAKNAAGSGANKQSATTGMTASATTAAAGKSTSPSIANPTTSTSSLATPTKSATNLTTMSTGSSTTPVTSPTTPAAGGSQVPTTTKPTTVATTNTGTTTGTATTATPSLGSITSTSPTLTSSGNPTTFNSSTPSTFNPLGSTAPILNLGLGFGFGGNFGLMTLPNGHHYYVYYPNLYGGYGSGYGYGYRNRYYGNGYSNNSNNSMYFAQMRRLSRLVNDLNSLTRGGNVAPAISSRLHSDLMGVVASNFRPSQQSVQQLSTDLATILPTRTGPMMNTGELAQHLMVVMNGGGQNMFQVQNSIAGAQGIMSMSGVPQQGIQRISSDLVTVSSF